MLCLARSAETYVVSCSCGTHTRVFCGDSVAFSGRVACRTCGEGADWSNLLDQQPAQGRSAEIIPFRP